MRTRWIWTDDAGPAELRRCLEDDGWAYFHMPESAALSQTPLILFERLFGAPPLHDEVSRIQVEDTPRNYSNTNVPARLHIDVPRDSVVPPHVQVMVCRRPAEAGGATVLLDAWDVLTRIKREDAKLYRALLLTLRAFRFAGRTGDPIYGTTLSVRRDQLVCLHAAVIPPLDSLGNQFCARLDREPMVEFTAEAGDVYITNNHRVVHGRRGFTDGRRDFCRVLAWLPRAVPVPARFGELVADATSAAATIARSVAAEPGWVLDELGLARAYPADRAHLRADPEPPMEARMAEMARIFGRLRPAGPG